VARRAPDADEFVTAATEEPEVARLREENARLSNLLGLVEKYHRGAKPPPRWLREGRKRGASGRGTACIPLSDLHLDEDVNPAELLGLNAFNRPVAEARLRRWAIKAVEQADRFPHEWDGALVPALGDLVTGDIHDELVRTNADVLPGTMVHWAPLLAAAYQAVADRYGRVHVPVLVGNHGRLGKRMQFKTRGRASWDWLLMQMVRAHLARDERFTWEFCEGSYMFVEVYGRHVFLSHGDEVKGGNNALTGVWGPLSKVWRGAGKLGAQHRIQPSYAVCGHWHQLTLAHSRGIVCNGSLKGPDEFTMGLRLDPEPAQQAWWVETPGHGPTVSGPLFVVDRRAEGW
jgi:hypothetical protein